MVIPAVPRLTSLVPVTLLLKETPGALNQQSTSLQFSHNLIVTRKHNDWAANATSQGLFQQTFKTGKQQGVQKGLQVHW